MSEPAAPAAATITTTTRLQQALEWCTDESVLQARAAAERAAREAHDDPAPARAVAEGVGVAPATAEVGASVWRDVELFDTPQGDGAGGEEEGSVFDAIFSPALTGTRGVLRRLLCSPQAHVPAIQERQGVLAALTDRYRARRARVDACLRALSEREGAVAALAQGHPGENEGAMYDVVYFGSYLTRGLNASEWGLSALGAYHMFVSPSIGLLSPIAYFVLPYLVLRWRLGLRLSFAQYLHMVFRAVVTMSRMSSFFGGGVSSVKYASMLFSLLFYFQGMWNSVQVSRLHMRIGAVITQHVDDMVAWAARAEELLDLVWDPGFRAWSPGAARPPPLPGAAGGRGQAASGKLHHPLLAAVTGRLGRTLKLFRDRDAAALRASMRGVYLCDALLAVARLQDAGAVPARFGGRGTELRGMWHPAVRRPVRNPVALGLPGARRGMIITGCNAAGKSTYIKGLVLNVLLAQSCHLCFAGAARLVPYRYVNTLINVPDLRNKESLFEAEMNRCRANLDRVARRPGDPALMVMDEIFSSTNPLEGICGAYAIARELARHAGSHVVFTTHYTFLTRLEADTDSFANFRFPLARASPRHPDAPPAFTYRLARGVSTDFMAIELLRSNGFDAGIVDTALRMKEAILSGGAMAERDRPLKTNGDGDAPSSGDADHPGHHEPVESHPQ